MDYSGRIVFPSWFSWNRYLREVTDEFASGGHAEHLLGSNTQEVFTTIKRCLHSVMEIFFLSRGSVQKIDLGNRVFFKVRATKNLGLESLVYRFLAEGAFKNVFGVVRCSGGPQEDPFRIYAYAKDPTLSSLHKAMRSLKNPNEIEQCQKSITQLEARLQHEVQLANQAPAAISTWIMYGQENPKKIKGIGMEYADENLWQYAKNHEEIVCSPLSLCLAFQMCHAVASTNQVGVCHGDVKLSNFLVLETPENSKIVLSDFGSSQFLHENRLCESVVSTFPPPEMCAASKAAPIRFSSLMDSWSLALAILQIVYGRDVVKKIEDYTLNHAPKYRFMLWPLIQRMLDKEPARCSLVDFIAWKLMQNLPQERRTARWAADFLYSRSFQVTFSPSSRSLSACLNVCRDRFCSRPRIELCWRLCAAVRQNHQLGLVHGSLRSAVIVLKQALPVLASYAPSFSITKACSYTGEDPPPEAVSEARALGLIAAEAAYGLEAKETVAALAFRGEKTVREFLQALSYHDPEVDEIIIGLMLPPERRWSAGAAEGAFIGILNKMLFLEQYED